ncbi:MAG: dihydroxyacetone kinase subunit L [Chloroflexi bacterium]|nr:dihydroxyacetone kinase subunit L [Chloroflexota bacterium]
MVTKEAVSKWLDAMTDIYLENQKYLTELDSAIGDGDHGNNMARGFKKVREKLPELQEKDIGGLLKGVGMTLMSTVGGASGPLYGTFYMRAGGAVDGKEELDLADVVALFDAGLGGVVSRGRAELGDKTMIDALTPAVEALKAAQEAGQSVEEALQAAAAAAEQGMKDTAPLQARKGRASYLGERSIGHQDPGSTSTYFMMKTASENLT